MPSGCEFNGNKSTTPSIQIKEEDVCPSVCEATTESAKVASTVHDIAMGKMEKQLIVWFHEMMWMMKKTVDSTVIRLNPSPPN